MTPTGKRLKDVFSRLGVPLVLARPDDRTSLFHRVNRGAPTGLGGIEWKGKGRSAVIWATTEMRRHLDLCALTHELAHVVVGTDPHATNEIKSPMLAFEAAVHDHCEISRTAVDEWMSNFGVDGRGGEWPDTSWSQRLDIMYESRTRAVAVGLLTREGELVWRRQRQGGDA